MSSSPTASDFVDRPASNEKSGSPVETDAAAVGEKQTATTSTTARGAPTVEEIIADLEHDTVIPQDAVDPTYARKAAVLNRAIQDIGMGWYQWQLFIVVGFGWANDNLWPVVTSLIFTPVASEFGPPRPAFLSLAQNIGLLAGALFWGFGCDIFGRRWAFNLTLGLTGLWGIVAAGSPSFVALGIFAAFWSFGVGGNLPVDSAIFLEFLPASHQYLLTVLSIDWAVAQVVANLIAWGLITNFSCPVTADRCARADNMGSTLR